MEKKQMTYMAKYSKSTKETGKLSNSLPKC